MGLHWRSSGILTQTNRNGQNLAFSWLWCLRRVVILSRLPTVPSGGTPSVSVPIGVTGRNRGIWGGSDTANIGNWGILLYYQVLLTHFRLWNPKRGQLKLDFSMPIIAETANAHFKSFKNNYSKHCCSLMRKIKVLHFIKFLDRECSDGHHNWWL